MMLLSSRFYSKDVDDLNGLFGEVVYETFTDWNYSLDVVPPMEYINQGKPEREFLAKITPTATA